MFTILFRMILWELCKVFVLSLVGITGILLMAGIIAEASQQGLGPRQILAAIPLLIPSTLPYTIPATTLFATCVVYGRLSADNEILAIKSSGVNIIHVVKPGLILGVVMSLCTLGLYYRVIPYTHHLLRAMVIGDVEELLYSMLRREHQINNPALPYAMFVKAVEGKKLINPVFKCKNHDKNIDIVAHSREAYLHVELARQLLVIRMRFGMAAKEDGKDCVDFVERKWEVALPTNFGKADNLPPRDMTWPELIQGQQDLEAELDKIKSEVKVNTYNLTLKGAVASLPRRIKQLKEKQKQFEHQQRLLHVEMLMRPALSFGCLCFILVGCPVGIMFSRGDYLGAFITCFLPIVIVYYPLMLCGTNMAKEGRLKEIPLVYAADLVVALGGLTLFRWLLKN